MPQTPSRHHTIQIAAGPDDAGARLDRWLAGKIPELSRARVQALIRDGQVIGQAEGLPQGGATIREPRTPVKPQTIYAVSVPDAEATTVQGENIALNVVYEDADLIVIDKPAGLVVHPAAGHATGTLVNALIAHCGDSLSGIGGIKRPGIVHRLDKDTSGLLVVAKTDAAHSSLSEQFKSHGLDGRLQRAYLAFAWGVPVRLTGTIDAPLARSATNRTKIAVVKPMLGRHARTHYDVVETFAGLTPAAAVSLLRLSLETGRTHQIRVHLAHIGHPVLGDPVYGAGFKTRLPGLTPRAQASAGTLGRQALHAELLAFEHPVTAKMLSFTSPLPPDLAALYDALWTPAKPSKTTDKAGRARSRSR